jgi:hypothetical protein
MFESEWKTYLENKARLLTESPGQYVVIHGDKIFGVYPNLAQAFDAGVKEYGPERFFLHRIVLVEPETRSPAVISVARPDSPIKYPDL